MAEKKGRFVVVEGCDGSGKTTLVRLLYEYFLNFGLKVVSTREPGGTVFGLKMRKLLKDEELMGIDPWTEFYLFCAVRRQHVVDVISPRLKDGYLILCDRFTPSTVAYQHYGRGLRRESVISMEAVARGGVYPDLIVLLDIDPRLSLARKLEAESDKFERQNLVFHQMVREGYLAQLQQESNRWFMIDATLNPEEVFQKARDRVLELLKQN